MNNDDNGTFAPCSNRGVADTEVGQGVSYSGLESSLDFSDENYHYDRLEDTAQPDDETFTDETPSVVSSPIEGVPAGKVSIEKVPNLSSALSSFLEEAPAGKVSFEEVPSLSSAISLFD